MSLVEFSVDEGVGVIRLNRPPVNALSTALVSAVDDAISQASHPSVRAAVVTGGDHFAAGADIKEFAQVFESDDEDQLAAGLGAVVTRLERLEIPTIAAVTGFALGGGLELAMGADFRYLGEGAKVGQPEISLGIIPGAGGTQRLARLIGYQPAKRLVMSGRMVESVEALQLGIADRVLPDEDVFATAVADAKTWAAGPTMAYAAAKRAMRGGYALDRGLGLELSEFQALFTTRDAREGIQAFLEKRDAEFDGT